MTLTTENTGGWRQTVWLLSIAVCVAYASILMILPFLPQYLQIMGIKDESMSFWVGLITGAPFFTMFFISPVWGRMADRWGYKWMILRALLGTALVTFLMAWATNPWQLLFLRLLEGLLTGVLPVSMAMVSAVTPKERSQFALGSLQVGLMAGVALGPLIGGWLVQVFHSSEDVFSRYRYTFLVATAALLLIILMIFWLLQGKKVSAEDAHSKKAEQGKLWVQSKRLLSQRPLGGLLLISFLLSFALFNYVAFLSVLIKELAIHEEDAVAWTSWSWATFAVASCIAAPMLGKLGDRLGSEKILAACLLGTSVFLFISSSVAYIEMMPIFSFLAGFFAAGLWPPLSALLVQEVPSQEIGSMYGLQSSLSSLAEGTGPVFFGFIGGLIGLRSIFMLTGLIMVGAFLLLIWLLKLIKKNSKA